MAVLKSRFKPRLILRGSNVRPLLGFGTNLTVAGLLDFLRNDLTRLLIGWVWGAEALGFYNRGTGLLVQPMNQIMGPISSVAMPALAALQHDHDRYRRYVRRAMELVAMLWTPLVVLLLVGAEDVVMVMLGPQWGPVVPVFIALGPSAIISGLTIGIGWACLPTGQSKRLREWKTFSAVVMMVVTAVSLSWGIVGAAAAFSGVITVLFIPAIIYCCRGTPVRLVDIMVPTWRSMTASAIAGGVAWYVHQLGRADALALIEPLHLGATGRSAAMLAMLGVVFGVVYAGAFVVLPGGWAKVREVLSLVLHLRHRKSKTPPTPAAPAAT
jgi:PST family polysaccharide transporter